jgi:hypothetical protein
MGGTGTTAYCTLPVSTSSDPSRGPDAHHNLAPERGVGAVFESCRLIAEDANGGWCRFAGAGRCWEVGRAYTGATPPSERNIIAVLSKEMVEPGRELQLKRRPLEVPELPPPRRDASFENRDGQGRLAALDNGGST